MSDSSIASSSHTHPNSWAREEALKFLYKCYIEKIFYYSDIQFSNFASVYDVPQHVKKRTKAMARAVLEDLHNLDDTIEKHSKNWSPSRMASIDRTVLRIACMELKENTTPKKVIMNEAIELAKRYGTSDSGSFVNGILDPLSQSIVH